MKFSKIIAEILLFNFWFFLLTGLIPPAVSASNCACTPNACECGKDYPCGHKGKKTEKKADFLLISAGCKGTRAAIASNLNFDCYLPKISTISLNKTPSKIFIRAISIPMEIFLDPPFIPPKSL